MSTRTPSPKAGRKHALRTFLAALLLSSGTADAGSFDLADEMSLGDLINLEVYTASKVKQPLRNTPATTHVITRKQILARGYRNLIDLLEMLPGFDIQRHSESARYNDVTMRGNFKHRRFIILQDGVQVDAPADDILAIADNYPLYYAKQVEVVYGPNSALWGTDAFGGVINIITLKGSDIDGGTLSASGGSDGFRYDHFVTGSRLSDKLQLSAGGHIHRSTTADLSKEYPELYAPADATTYGGDIFMPASQREPYYAPESSYSLFARADYGDNLYLGFKRDRMENATSTGTRPAYAISTEDAKMVAENTTLYGHYGYPLSDSLDGMTSVNYGLRELLPESRFKQIYTDFLEANKYAKGERLGIEQQFDYRWSEQHTLIWGIAYQDFYAVARTGDTPDRYNPNLSPAAQDLNYHNVPLKLEVFDLDYSTAGSYLQLGSEWTEKLSSTLGIRFDHHSEFGDSWNPRLGLVYHATREDTWRLLYGEAFRAPSPADAMFTYGTFSTDKNDAGEYISYFMRAPNLDLEPEKMRALELSFARYWDGGSLSVSTFYSEIDNIIVSVDTDTPVQFVPGGDIRSTVTTRNLNSETYYGVDLSTDQHWDLEGGVTADLWGAYSYINGVNQRGSAGLRVAPGYIASHKLRLGLTLGFRNRYSITPKLRINSETTSNQADPDNPTKRIMVPGHGVLDLSVGARNLFGLPGLDGKLNIYNLLDRRFYNAGGQGSPVFFESKPQEPRTWYASVSYKFDL